MSSHTATSVLFASILLAQLCMTCVNGQSCSSAAGTCHGFGGGKLCGDRCRGCGYQSGSCSGLGFQTCQCYHGLLKTIVKRDAEPSPRGFGCPGNEYECNRHCKSNGFRGGYCNALTAWLRCDCY